VTRVLCPPFVSLPAVRDALQDPAVFAPDGAGVGVGAQNVHRERQGAYTGEVSAPMLQGLATWVIVGHSERRRDFGETDEVVAEKLARVIESGLRPILCVGESLESREAGASVAAGIVVDQLVNALRPNAGEALWSSGLVVAYEPVWAIGTGRNASGADAAAMADAIRGAFRSVAASGSGAGADPAVADGLPILYGGSVSSSNIEEFMAEPSLDGALVGGASLKPDEMAAIVARAGLTAQARAAARS
jgi:triosephosphate isomerase